MELNEVEQKIVTDLWNDELRRNAIQKAIIIASAGTPELPVGALHILFAGVESQKLDEEEELLNSEK